jgi:hypothetical protein
VKNLTILEAPDDVVRYVRALWRTTQFRESAFVDSWVQRFAASATKPTIFAEMSDAELEYPHFATWFGVTYHRSYDHPAVSDLYYLHELVHAALLTYQAEPLFTAWYRKMNGIELSASLETECNVYLSVPGLREVAFADEIWVDRFLGGGRSRLGESLKDVIRQERYKAMQHPDPMDYCEQQIAAYARQNFEWAGIWKLDVAAGGRPPRPAFILVEEHLARLREGALTAGEHLEWLKQFGEIPFPDQARLFAQVYWHNKLSYRLRHLP